MSGPENVGALEMARAYVKSLQESGYEGHGSELYATLSVLAATTSRTALIPTSITFRLRLPERWQNGQGNLHGGATATLFDNLTSVALGIWVARVAAGDLAERWALWGVSRTINTSYLRAVEVGTEVDVLCEVVAVGRRLAFLRGQMVRSSDGKVVATCEHHKAAPDLAPETKL